MIVTCPEICYGMSTFTAPVITSLSNYGTYFHKVGTVLNGVSYHQHLFAIPLPLLNIPPIPLIPCVSATNKALFCESINREITETNTLIQTRMSKYANELAKSLESVGNVGPENVPRTDGGVRKRRSTSVVAGPEYCKDHNSGTNNPNSGPGFNPFAIAGEIGSNLLQTPTFSDIEAIANQICETNLVIDLNSKEILKSEQRLDTLSKQSHQSIHNLTVVLKDNIRNIDTIRTNFEETAEKYDGALDNLTAYADVIGQGVNLLSQIMFETQKALDRVAGIGLELENFKEGIRILVQGKTPRQFVSINDIEAVLQHLEANILTQYGDSFKLVDRRGLFHSELKDISYVRSDDFLYIGLKIPITNTAGELSVYRVDTYPVILNGNDTKSSIITNIPDFFAITSNSAYYVEMTTTEFASCRGEILKVCPLQRSLKQISQPSCVSAIYTDNIAAAKDLCRMTYNTRKLDTEAFYLSNSTYYIVNTHENDTWYFSCKFGEALVSVVEPCRTCQIQIPCGCSLTSSFFSINSDVSICSFSRDTTYPTVNIVSTINKLVAAHYYSKDTLDLIAGNGHTELTHVPLPSYDIVETKWGNVVEDLDNNQISLNNLIIQNEKESLLFTTREEELKHNISLIQAKYKRQNIKVSNFFENTLVNPTTAFGISILPMILTVVTACLIVYIFCFYKR